MFLSLYLPTFLGFFAAGLLGPVTPLYMDSFEVRGSTLGLMLAMVSIGKMSMDLPGGILIPRLGIKKSMLLGSFMIGISSIGMFLSKTWPQVLVYQFLLGAGNVFLFNARLSYAAAMTENENRGRTLSILGGTNRLSLIFSPALGGILVTAISLRFPFVVSGIFVFAAMALMTTSIPDVYAQPRQATSSLPVLWQVFKKKADVLWRVGVGAFLLTTVRMARFTLLPLFASNVLNLTASQIGIILSAASIADIFNVYTAGTLMDRFGRRWAAIPCVGVMAISMLLMPLTTGFWGLLIVGVIAGVGNGFGSGIMMTMGSDLAPAENREEFLSLWTLVLDLGGIACPLIVGAISESFSLLVSGFAFFGIGILGVLAFLFLVPETRRKPKAAARKIEPAL